MKITKHTQRAEGMTLLELTVVILVLLSLISILFIGARAWKRGSDRAGCIMNIRNVQQAVRSYANMYNSAETFDEYLVFGPGKFIEQPISDLYCPQEGSGAYGADNAGVIPDVGVLYVSCSAPTEYKHIPDEYSAW